MVFRREASVRSAEKYVSKGKLEAAIKEYKKVLLENPDDINTLNRVGDLYARIERYDEAVSLFSKIAERYTRDGFFVKAIAIYKKIIKLDPTALAVYERLAELYYKQGLLNEARTQYQVLADYYQKHDNATSAITIYQRMSEMEPDNPSFHLKLAELFESQLLIDKALKEYRALADLLIVAGSVDEAVQVYAKALEIGAEQPAFVRVAVGGLREAGNTDAAQRVLDRALELNPELSSLASEMGLGADDSLADDYSDLPADEAPAAGADGAFDLPAESLGFDDPSYFEVDPAAPDAAFDAPVEVFEAPAEAFDVPAGDDASSAVDAFDFTPDPTAAGDATVFAGSDLGEPADDGAFVLDLDDDIAPDSLVQPPPDMAADADTGFGDETQPTGELPEAADDVFTFELDLEDDEPAPTQIDPAAIGAEPAPAFDAPSASGPDLESGEQPFEPLEDLSWDEDAAAGTQEVGSLAADGPADLEFDLEFDDAPPPADDLPSELQPEALGDGSTAPSEELPELELDPAFALEDGLAAPVFDEPLADAPPLDDAPLDAPPLDAPPLGDATVAAPVPLDDVPLDDATVAASVPVEEEEEPPPAVRREEDLVAEARVFLKYGLREKAADRLEELLGAHPDHLEGLALRTRLDLESGHLVEAMARVNELSTHSQARSDVGHWKELRRDMAAQGFRFEGSRAIGVPGERPPQDDRIAQLLEDLSLDAFEPTGTPTAAGPFDALLEEQEAEAAAAQAATDSGSAAAAPTPPAAKHDLTSLVDELGLDDDELTMPTAAAPSPVADSAPADAAPAPTDLDETGMSWLDDAPAAADVEAGAASDAIFDEEDDFFDLAAELEAELDLDAVDADLATSIEPQEQSLEEIIEGFKQGVAENLSAEDYDTHFNLGIAYREMGLMDEAIGEFQLSSKDPRYLVESASMLGICFLEKGLPDLAVRWYKRGLAAPNLGEEAQLGLLYDLGEAFVAKGDADSAYRTFVEVYGQNTNYRDVSTRLQELAPQGT
ncbi:MAG: tetratricopeptide repeat protein [Acidobacteriota bacterium]